MNVGRGVWLNSEERSRVHAIIADSGEMYDHCYLARFSLASRLVASQKQHCSSSYPSQ